MSQARISKETWEQVKIAYAAGAGLREIAHRCIECHTLPPLWRYSVEDWPKVVNTMSHRASLKPGERDAVVAYIIAVRSTE
jgi:hypothetical protein